MKKALKSLRVKATFTKGIKGPLIQVKKPITKNKTPTIINGFVVFCGILDKGCFDIFLSSINIKNYNNFNDIEHILARFGKPNYNIRDQINQKQHLHQLEFYK